MIDLYEFAFLKLPWAESWIFQRLPQPQEIKEQLLAERLGLNREEKK